MRLCAAGGSGPLLVAHRGSPLAAPENSLAGVEAALESGADIVEVDVSERGGELVLAHSQGVARPDAPTLSAALAFFRAHAGPETGIQLDVKPRRVEAALVDSVRAAGLVERTLVSSTFADVLRRVRSLEPALATALGYPYDRAQVSERGLLPDIVMRRALASMRVSLPPRAVRMARAARADLLSLHHLVVSAGAVRRLHEQGIGVFTWTVNDQSALERVLALGVDGVVTDDPSLMRSP